MIPLRCWINFHLKYWLPVLFSKCAHMQYAHHAVPMSYSKILKYRFISQHNSYPITMLRQSRKKWNALSHYASLPCQPKVISCVTSVSATLVLTMLELKSQNLDFFTRHGQHSVGHWNHWSNAAIFYPGYTLAQSGEPDGVWSEGADDQYRYQISADSR